MTASEGQKMAINWCLVVLLHWIIMAGSVAYFLYIYYQYHDEPAMRKRLAHIVVFLNMIAFPYLMLQRPLSILDTSYYFFDDAGHLAEYIDGILYIVCQHGMAWGHCYRFYMFRRPPSLSLSLFLLLAWRCKTEKRGVYQKTF